jgi:hypothetical protein
MKALKRTWLALIIVFVVVIAGFAVERLREVFASRDETSTPSGMNDESHPFNPKRVTYEVWSANGTVANINYLDINAQPQRLDNTALPWSLSVTTTAPAVAVNIIAQGDTDSISCRITVDGIVKDEKTTHEVNAQTFCWVKSA